VEKSVEETLFIFPDPLKALTACLKSRDAIDEFDRKCNETTTTTTNQKDNHHSTPKGYDSLILQGIGIHSGDIVWIPNTNVHWGDPVNTASKLGEDLARNKDIYISETSYSKIKDMVDEIKLFNFESKLMKTEKDQFPSYLVNWANHHHLHHHHHHQQQQHQNQQT